MTTKHRPLSQLLAEYEVPWREHPWPLDWRSVFGRRAPLVLEIGFGNGEFLVQQAAENPDRDHVGIELAWGSASRLYKRLDHARLKNVRALFGPAEALMLAAFAPSSLDEAYINHPCPWRKERHHYRRLIQAPFLELLADRLKPDARVTIVTDHTAYAAWIVAALEAQDVLTSCHPTTRVDAIPGRRTTRYERKALGRGETIDYFQWKRTGTGRSVPVPAIDPDMPSLTLCGDTPPASLFDGFEPQTFQEHHDGVDLVVKLQSVWSDPKAESYLIETLVQEGALRQDFALLVLPRDGAWLLKLSSLGQPRATWGVKRALACLGRWLRKRHPRLECKTHTLAAAAEL